MTECYLTDCALNCHDNLRFDDFGYAIGPCYCTAKDETEIYEELGYGVPDYCPLLNEFQTLQESKGSADK